MFSAPKGNRERRLFHIVHPRSQAVLSDLLSRNWTTIARWKGRSKYSYDKIDVVTQDERAIPRPEFFLHRSHKESIVSVSNWVTETDIARFYPSIYTHSITWAAYGKEEYKKNPKKYKLSLGDQVDIATRKCNRNQTVGIPIGPDTSRIVAEVVSAYVDTTVLKNTGLPRAEADRLQDDWIVGSATLEQAESRLSGIIRAYQDLGLDINGSKTDIKHVADWTYPVWTAELLAVRTGGSLAGDRLNEFLRLAIALQIRHPVEPVLAYVYGILLGTPFSPGDIPILQSFITRSVAVDSRVVDSACILLLNLNFEKFPLDRERIASRFVPLLEAALQAGHSFEAIWTLHLFRGLKMDIGSTRVSSLSETLDSACTRLVMLDLQSRGLLNGLPIAIWQKQVAVSDFNEPVWLLAYEGVRHGWLADPLAKVRTHPLLSPMFDRNIQFYDPKRNVPSRKVVRKRRLDRAKADRSAAFALWMQYPN